VTARRQALGAAGEAQAARWYEAQGYTVLARNWRCRQGELDLVLSKGGLVVFCEVKTRTTDAFGAPVEAVTRAKQVRLRGLAASWIGQSAVRPREVRFDVASVLAGRLDVIEGAF
jgi:putative endonuclease